MVNLDLSDLPQYRLLRFEQTEHDFHFYAEVKESPAECIYCQSSSIIRWSSREQFMKDLPMQGKHVGLCIETKRYRCSDCAKTFMEPLPEMAEGHAMTKRLAQWLCQQSTKRTFTSLADETGVVEGTVRNLFRDYLSELEKNTRFETPLWMGIDDIQLIKPRCMVSNIRNHTIVNMLADCTKETVVAYLSTLDNRDHVQYVAMDMWVPYREAVDAVLPHATIVIDPRYVTRMADDVMEKVRKRLRESLSAQQRRGLMNDRRVLLKRRQDLNDKEALALEGWMNNYPLLGEVYLLKEAFYALYDATNTQDACERYLAWCQSMTPDAHAAYANLMQVWTNWLSWILNYFRHPITGTYAESLDHFICVTDRLGRGYSFEALRAKILFTDGLHQRHKILPGKERLYEPPMVPQSANETIERKSSYSIPVTPNVLKVAEPVAAYRTQAHNEKCELNYGVDIKILTSMLESGAFE